MQPHAIKITADTDIGYNMHALNKMLKFMINEL